jgi:hypothetical protein
MTHKKGRRLSFEDKRQIAKLIAAGWAPKVIAIRENVCLALISHIKRDFVRVVMTERYPDDPQMKLPLDDVRQRAHK